MNRKYKFAEKEGACRHKQDTRASGGNNDKTIIEIDLN